MHKMKRKYQKSSILCLTFYLLFFLGSTMFVSILVAFLLLTTLSAPIHCQSGRAFSDWFSVLGKYEPFLRKYGPEGLSFLMCMGIHWAEHCIKPTVLCSYKRDSKDCIQSIICGGENAGQCGEKHLHA